MSGKTWEFTINNYTSTDVEWLESLKNEVSRIKAAKEMGESGTAHIQGAITFKGSKRLTTLKKLHNKAHWELKKQKDCWVYQNKIDGDLFIDTNNSQQGKRNDIANLVKDIKTKSKRELWEEHPETMLKYWRGAYEMKTQFSDRGEKAKYKLEDFKWEKISDWSKSHIIWGEPGIGKTQFALAHFNNPFFCTHLDDLKEFVTEVYDGIVFDDMSFLHLPRESQINIVDQDQGRSIHTRFTNAYIPKNTKKIFTTNHKDGRIFLIKDGAISRRVTVTEVA